MIAVKADLVRLPERFCFEDYRIYVMPAARDAFVGMAGAALKDSVHLIVDSGYRSGEFQEKIIKRRMAAGEDFEAVARFVAPPGYSQHETGCAFDLVPSEARFAHTETYAWLSEHAAEYGFVETYPEDSTHTRYWESWHWYYRGEQGQ